MQIDYIQTNDYELQSRIRARYEHDLNSLAILGFRPLCFYVEQLGSFSAVFQFPILLLMLLKKEVISIQRPLQISAGFALLYHTDPPTIALPMGIGIKLYTGFTDQSMLISYTFISQAQTPPGSPIRKIMTVGGLQDTWQLHKDAIAESERRGKTAIQHTTFASYVDMSHREEYASQFSAIMA